MSQKNKTKDPMDAVLSNIEKQMGNTKSPFLTRFKNVSKTNVETIPFGIADIDKASYCGGIPRGKMVEIFGPESSGKSLVSYYLISSAQKMGEETALLDIEQSFDPVWAAQHGVDVDNLVWGNSFESGEQCLEYAYQLCKSGKFAIVVIDSTAALTPKSEIDGSLEDNARVGEQARMMSRSCRKIRAVCGPTNTTCIFINQLRMKIGVMYGNPETTPGGKALKFYSDMRIRVQGKTKIKAKDNGEEVVIGQHSSITFVKNKVGRPFGRAEFKIMFDPNALNPVFMLANAARNAKLIRPYKGVMRIGKNVLDNEKTIDTGTTTMVEMANYLVNNNMVLPLLEKLEEATEEDPTLDRIDGAILEMKTNPDKIEAPSDDKAATMETQKVNDSNALELADEIKEEIPKNNSKFHCATY